MSGRKLILAIDGGGSKTDVVLAQAAGESLEVLARVVGGAANPAALGLEASTLALRTAIDQALAEAGASPDEVVRALIALAGVGDDTLRRRIQQWATQSGVAADIAVLTDAECVLAIADSLTEAPAVAVAVIAGTGSCAMGVFGTEVAPVRAGGWGYLMGDDGSGFAIGRAAIRSVLAESEGRGPATALSAALFAHTSAGSPRGVISHFHGSPDIRRAIAGVARLVADVADAGDAVARGILRQAGQDLAELVRSVLLQLGSDERPYVLTCAGSVLVQNLDVRAGLKEALEASQRVPQDLYVIDDVAMAAARIAAG